MHGGRRTRRRAGFFTARAAEAGDHLYAKAGVDAVRHLFRVAASLDSMVRRRAADPRAGEGGLRPRQRGRASPAPTSRACATAPSPPPSGSAPRPRSAAAPPSMSQVAVELVEKIFGDLEGRAILLVGAGKMGALSAKALADLGADRILVTNRSAERGLALAHQVNGDVPRAGRSSRACSSRPTWSSSRPARRPTCSRRDARPGGHEGAPPPLALPHRPRRPAQRGPGLRRAAPTSTPTTSTTWRRWSRRRTRRARGEAAPGRGHRRGRGDGLRARSARRAPRCRCSPQLRRHAEAIARAEAERTLAHLGGKLDEKGRRSVEAMAQAIVNKLLHGPTARLKEAAAVGRRRPPRRRRGAVRRRGRARPPPRSARGRPKARRAATPRRAPPQRVKGHRPT